MKGNAVIGGACIRSESGSAINGRDFADSIINNMGRVVTIKEERTHLRAFVRDVGGEEIEKKE